MSASVLIADDDPFHLRLLEELCVAAGYRVVTAAEGAEVLRVVARDRPDVIVLDVDMTSPDGVDVLKVLKGDQELCKIPIIVITERDADRARTGALDLGAEDWVTRPFRVYEVQLRIRNVLRRLAAESAARAIDSTTGSEFLDPLTRAGTARQLVIMLDYEVMRASRYGSGVGVVRVRIENLTEIVRVHGNETAYGILAQVGQSLRGAIRAVDHLFRSGDSELAVVLPETDPAGAGVVLGRIRARIGDETLWGLPVAPRPVVAVGIATGPSDDAADARALLERAAPTV